MKLQLILCAALLLLGAGTGYCAHTYDIPSLNKVKFEKAENHAPIQLVKNGKLQFAIVADLKADKAGKSVPSGKPLTAERQSAHVAIKVLQKNFERMTGQKPEVFAPGDKGLKKYPYQLLIGKSKSTDRFGIDIKKMPKEGFVVRTFKDGIMIVGHDGNRIPGFYHDIDLVRCLDNGTVNGVYDFLERIMGMRFYYPGIGVYVPQIKDLQVKPVAYSDHPRYYVRSFGRITNGFAVKGKKRVTTGRTVLNYWPWDDVANDSRDFNHAYRAIRNTRFVCSESPHPFKMQQAFPDKIETMFAKDKDGKLHYSTTVYTDNYYDISNPEFLKLMANAYKKFYDTNGKWNPIWGWFHPTPEYMCFGAVDTHKVIDNEFTRKHKRRNPNASSIMSEINSHFYLELAKVVQKTLPGKKLAVMAYANYLYPPETIQKFPDNVRVMVCVGTPVYIRHPGYKAFFTEMYDGWNKKLADKVVPYLYDPSYYPQGAISHAIRGYFEGEFLREMAKHLSKEDLFPCVHFQWEYYYSYYLLARAYWNPDFDVDAAQAEHFRLLFGEKSAKHLNEFYKLLIDRWVNHYLPTLKVERRCIPAVDYTILYKKAFNKDVGTKMKKILAAAKKDLIPGSEAKRRFDFFAMPWERVINEIYAYQRIKVGDYKIRFGSPVVDGNLDDAIWKKAIKMNFRDAFYGEHKKGAVYPDVRLVWDKKGIYLAFRATAPYAKTGKLWGEDNFEVFLSPGLRKDKIFQLVFSSSDKYEDYFTSYDPPRPTDALWKCSNVKKVVKADKKGWTAEIFIPFYSLDKSAAPIPGDYWYGNLVSNRNGASAVSLSPTQGNNRNISMYARLYFAGNCE
ncbi:MAG: DUF4838 domain-containing protein [Lentisphaeria bacterium]|nr:DUF4838 domain-containing protein [Lentisphaeria bacterium]